MTTLTTDLLVYYTDNERLVINSFQGEQAPMEIQSISIVENETNNSEDEIEDESDSENDDDEIEI